LNDRDAGVQLYGVMNCWDVGAITDMNSLFHWKSTMNEDIGCWDVSNVTNMEYMFYGASSFNQHVEKWKVSNVSNMAYMFYGASSFNQSLCHWYPMIKWNLVTSHYMLLYSGCDFPSTPSISYSTTFCQLCHSFPSRTPSKKVTNPPSNMPSFAIECPFACSGNGKCRYPGICECQLGWGGSDCSTPSCAKSNFCSGNGNCTAYETCSCIDGYYGSSCSIANCTLQNYCNGNGICSSPSVCSCYHGYAGADCNSCDNGFRNVSGACIQCPNCLNGGTCNDQVIIYNLCLFSTSQFFLSLWLFLLFI
jgi:surface protein